MPEPGSGYPEVDPPVLFLEKKLLPKSDGDFRLGKELFEKKLKITLQSDLTSDEIIRRAEEEIVATRKRMFQLAKPLHQEMFPGRELKEEGKELENRVIREVLDEIAKDHPKKDELLEVCRQNLKEQEQFVREKDLLDLTGINPLEVDWEPDLFFLKNGMKENWGVRMLVKICL